MKLLGAAHGRLVHRRRVAILAQRLAPHIPPHARVIDIGCGDGAIAAHLHEIRPDISVRGFDVFTRADTAIPVELFDGMTLPCDDGAADIALLVDVLHHTDDPRVLLQEAVRAARAGVLVKDHVVAGPLATPTLRLMDWFGNAPHGVRLPFNYWTLDAWQACFRELGVQPRVWDTHLSLYPWPASMFFDRSLHVLAHLTQNATPAGQ